MDSCNVQLFTAALFEEVEVAERFVDRTANDLVQLLHLLVIQMSSVESLHLVTNLHVYDFRPHLQRLFLRPWKVFHGMSFYFTPEMLHLPLPSFLWGTEALFSAL